MPTHSTIDRSAVLSLVIGTVGAILTGLVHWGIMTSPHDFLVRDSEFLLVASLLLVVIGLSVWDFKQGFSAMRHLSQPHGRFAKPLALTGISLGIADLLPTAILLIIMLEALAFRFIPLPNLINF